MKSIIFFLGLCDPIYKFPYFDSIITMETFCLNKVGEFKICTIKDHCLGALNCTDGVCQCLSTEYYEPKLMTCLPKTLYNTSCTETRSMLSY